MQNAKVYPAHDPESVLIREVYARYGLAMFMAQVLEHGIVNAMLAIKILPLRVNHTAAKEWEAALDDFFSAEFEKTFGGLVTTLTKAVALPDEVKDRLIAARDTRNMLAHRFFRNHDMHFMTTEGRGAMIAICDHAAEEFSALDQALEAFCAPHREKHGITQAWLGEKFAEMEAEARLRFPKA